jgi:hypothetical protein
MLNMLVKTSTGYIYGKKRLSIIPWRNPAYVECSEREAEYQGLKGEWLKKTYDWDKDNPRTSLP